MVNFKIKKGLHNATLIHIQKVTYTILYYLFLDIDSTELYDR